jgi:hypothetical protein
MLTDYVPTPPDSRGTDGDVAVELVESGCRDPEAATAEAHRAYAKGYAEGVADALARAAVSMCLPQRRALLTAAREQGFQDGIRAVLAGHAAVRGAGRQ